MGQGWKLGENEMGVIITTLGDGNLVDRQPGEVLDGVAVVPAPVETIPAGVDLTQMKLDIAAIKLKLGM